MTDELNLEAWHAWRRGGVGGSDIAALIGLSRYGSPTSLFYEKIGTLDDEREDTPRQRIGKRMEHVLADEFHDHTGLHVVGAQTWSQHPWHPWARCTVDGFVADHRAVKMRDADLLLGTVQMKTDGRFGWPDGIPPNVRAQCIWEMGVTDQAHCWLIVMFAGFRVEVFEIHFDDDARSDWLFMLDVARTFWTAHVLTLVPPPVDDHEATAETLTRVFGLDPAGILDADDRARALVLDLQLAKARTKAAKAEETVLSNELRALIGSHTDLVDGWKPAKSKNKSPVPNVIASWRPHDETRLDPDALRSAEPEIADKFSTTSTVRTLRVSALPKEI